MSSAQEFPPVFEPTTQIELNSVASSKITHVSVYPTRAEVTRLFRFTVKTGQNLVNIKGLPVGLEHESLRVEGRGAATIHDVTISELPKSSTNEATLKLNQLLEDKQAVEEKLRRCRKGQDALESYLKTLNAEHTDANQLERILDCYENAGGKLHAEVAQLEKRLKQLEVSVEEERKNVAATSSNDKLRLQVSVGVFAASENDVEIVLIYAVNDATWRAFYDIRVDMNAKDEPISVIYKAAIKQDTGESWDDVVLSLETIAPTIGVEIPKLPIWRMAAGSASFPGTRSKGLSFGISKEQQEVQQALVPGAFDSMYRDIEVMEHRGLGLIAGGTVNTTFRVPGSATMPSDGVEHHVTISQLSLKAEMSWVALPRVDNRTHLRATIINESEYTLLEGKASVYVDGSFIARTTLPRVHPQETFVCPLGVDPSVKVTYHPQTKKISKSGLVSKTTTYAISQRITVYNTKVSAIERVKIIDHIPVSEQQNVQVKLLSPALTIPEPTSGDNEKEKAVMPPPLAVGDGVVAHWEGADEAGTSVDSIGHDGKFYWLCSVPSLGKVNLHLQWELHAPSRIYIGGLD